MAEKVIFEFRVNNEKDGVRYQIRQGEKMHTYSGKKVSRCFPLVFFRHPKSFVRMHSRFFHHSKKHVRETLNTLENMYADFYRNHKSNKENNNHG
jgi:hypothetical protein